MIPHDMAAHNAVLANNAFFLFLEALLRSPGLLPEHAGQLVEIAMYFALRRESGCYSSPVLEAPFLALAASLPLPAVSAGKGSLCVMTQAHSEGGHPQMPLRMAQHLMEYAPYSLFLTGQGAKPLPVSIRAAFERSGGSVTLLPAGLSVSEKGAVLREHGMSAERVLLATHMDDASPIVAFGHAHFPRPVFFFNHADHRFWIGRSVCDAVLDFRAFGQDICRRYRGNPPSRLAPLPFEQTVPAEDKRMLRARLGLPADLPILLTVGSSYKFTPDGALDFRLLVREVFRRIPHSRHVIIGPSPEEAFWKNEARLHAGRLLVVGVVQRECLPQWLGAADLYVESLPFGGGFAVVDAVQQGLPATGLENPGQPLDCMRESGALFADIAALAENIAHLLKEEHARTTLHEKQLRLAERDHSLQHWTARLHEALASVRQHSADHDWKRDCALTEYEEFKNRLLINMARFPTLRLAANILLRVRKLRNAALQIRIVAALVTQIARGLR